MQVAEIERQLQQSTQERRRSAWRWSTTNPLNRESMLRQAVAETKAEFDRLNARTFEYQSLKREADADKTLYEELVRKIKEAGINAGFQNSSIRIADPARAAVKPVFPNLTLNVAIGFPVFLAAGGGRRRHDRLAGQHPSATRSRSHTPVQDRSDGQPADGEELAPRPDLAR